MGNQPWRRPSSNLGYPLLGDDLLIVQDGPRPPLVFPGPPRIKLFPEIAQAILGDLAKGSPLNTFTNKLIIPLDASLTCQTTMPLKRFFVLKPTNHRTKRVIIRKMPQRSASGAYCQYL